jgi:hypothetical protein
MIHDTISNTMIHDTLYDSKSLQKTTIVLICAVKGFADKVLISRCPIYRKTTVRMILAIYIWVKLQCIDREEEIMYPRSLQRGACPNLAREKPNGLVKT